MKKAELAQIWLITIFIPFITISNPLLAFGGPAAIPDDVLQFLDQYSRDVRTNDPDKIMVHYSESFLLNDRDKKGTELFWKNLLKRISIRGFKVALTRFQRQGALARVWGFVTLNGRESPLRIPMIIKEEGEWKWYGDDKGRNPAGLEPATLEISFADPEWDGEKIPEGQQ